MAANTWCIAVGLLLLWAAIVTRSDARKLGYFWQITDAHLDLSYLVGGDPNCDSIQCCRAKSPTQKNFAGPLGDYKCDFPLPSFQATLDFVRSFALPDGQKPAFIHYGGDDTPHDDWKQSQAYNLNYISTVHNALSKTFDPWTVLPTLGNHDTYPVDQVKVGEWSWLLEPVAAEWARWLPPQAVNSTRRSGFYSIPNFLPGLTIINLYSQYEDPINFYLVLNPNDPGGQLAWLASELATARANKQKVYIFAHIPVGICDRSSSQSSTEKFNIAYEKIIQQYHDIIQASFHGHTHEDSLRIVLSEDAKQAVHVGYIAPAATPWQNHNPAVRLYSYDTDTYEIVDYTSFYANLTRANEIGKLVFQPEYSPLNAYSLRDLSPQSWLDFVNSMFKDDVMFKLFVAHWATLGPAMKSSCEGQCRVNQLCAMQSVIKDKYEACLAAHRVGI